MKWRRGKNVIVGGGDDYGNADTKDTLKAIQNLDKAMQGIPLTIEASMKLNGVFTSKTKLDAAGLFADWIAEARATEVDDLVAMASTIEGHLAGILGFWEFRGASNASVEGFNNKIRWLIKQAYGYHDFKYFKLKIFDLPNLKSRDGDC